MKKRKGIVLTVLAAIFLSTSLFASTVIIGSKVSMDDREGRTADSIHLSTF